jgi:hypothetical protein
MLYLVEHYGKPMRHVTSLCFYNSNKYLLYGVSDLTPYLYNKYPQENYHLHPVTEFNEL